MKRTAPNLLVPCFVILFSAMTAAAHHSIWAQFDRTKPVMLTGTVTKVEWMNPHMYFYMDVKEAKTGKFNKWACEMASPNALVSQGWTRNTLQAGMVVSLEGMRAKDGTNKVHTRNVMVHANGADAASTSR